MRPVIVLLAVVAVGTIVILALQGLQIHRLNDVSAHTDCWARVLDKAIAHHLTPGRRAGLLHAAKACRYVR